MYSRALRYVCVVAILSSLIAVTVLAADPWHTGNPWNAPSSAASTSAQGPRSMISSVPSVGTVPTSVPGVPHVSFGVVPTPNPLNAPFAGSTPIAPLTAAGIGLTGNASAGAHIVAMKCAGCHGQDGSGHGVEMIGMNARRQPIPWTDRSAMSGLTDQQIAAKISQSDTQQNPDSVMPSFGSQLTSQDISDVVAYIRMLGQ